MYSINPFHNPRIAFSDIPTQETNKPIWLWLLLGIGGYFLLRKKKKPAQRESQTPIDLHGLSGNLRTCDAWFEVEDKRGFKSHRCFIYKPTCNTKKCKKDPHALKGGYYVKTARDYGVWNSAEALAEYLKDVHGDVDRDIEIFQRAARVPNIPINDVTEAISDIEIINQRLQELEAKQGNKANVSRETNLEMQGVSYGLGDLETEKAWLESIPINQLEHTYRNLAKIQTDTDSEYRTLTDYYYAMLNKSITANAFKGYTGLTPSLAAKHLERLKAKSQENQFLYDYAYKLFKKGEIIPKKKLIEEKGGQMTLFGIRDVFAEPTHFLSLINSVLTTTTLKNMSHEERDDLYLELRKIENRWEYYAKNIETDYQNDKIKSNLKKAIGILSRYRQNQFTLFGQLSGYTATCLKFGKNRLGHKSCLKYAPTCGSAADGCRIEPLPVPGSAKEAKLIEKEKEIQADAMAKMLAYEANTSLDQNKELMREIISQGGLRADRGGELAEEFTGIPKKYKRKDGFTVDEMAQQLGLPNDTELYEKIHTAESMFDYLKSLRGGETAKRFKAEDFMNEAWDRIDTGRGFMGFTGDIQKTKEQFYAEQLLQEALNLESNIGTRIWNANSKKWADYYRELANDFLSGKIKADDSVNNAHWKQEFAKYNNLYNKIYYSKKLIPEQTSFLEPSQISLFGELNRTNGVPRIKMGSMIDQLLGIPILDEYEKKNIYFDTLGSDKMKKLRDKYLLDNKCSEKDINFYNEAIFDYSHNTTRTKALELAIIVNRLNNLPDLHNFGEYAKEDYEFGLKNGEFIEITPGMMKAVKLAIEFNQEVFGKVRPTSALYRGVRGWWADNFRKSVGNKRHGAVEIDTFPFASTSADKTVATRFATLENNPNPRKWEKGLVFVMDPNPDLIVDTYLTHPYLDDQLTSDKRKQYEVLLHSGNPIPGEYFDMQKVKELPSVYKGKKLPKKTPPEMSLFDKPIINKPEKIIAEKGGQMTLFGELGKMIPLYTTWDTWYYDTNDCKNKIFTVKARKEMGIKGGKSVHGCMVTDPSFGNSKFWMAEEKASKLMKNPKPQQQLTLFGGYHG